MSRPSKTEQELGYLRAFWNEARVLQSDYTAAVGFYAYPTERIGVWSYRLVFTPLVADAENHVGSAAVQFLYPNGESQSFAGALWRQCMKLTELVATEYERRGPGKNKRA